MPDNLAHIVSQTRQNVEYLVAQGQLSRPDGNVILNRLPTASDISVRQLSDSTRNLVLSGNSTTLSRMPTANPAPARAASPPALVRRTYAAKALYSYNEDRAEPNDLSFVEGDVIDVVEESNADWWTGRHNGREGLFPASYIEKITSSSVSRAPTTRAVAAPVPAPTPPSQNSNNGYACAPPSNPGYANPPPQNQGYAGPPPPTPGYGGPPPFQGYGPPPPQSYGPPAPYQPYPPQQAFPPPQPQGQVVVVEAPQQQQSRGLFGGGGGGGGGLGSLFGASLIGGLGAGAGGAIGGGIVDSIFHNSDSDSD